jgi:hypothetical protein
VAALLVSELLFLRPLTSDSNPLSSPQLRIITVDPPFDAAPSAEIVAQEAENWTHDLRAVQNDLHSVARRDVARIEIERSKKDKGRSAFDERVGRVSAHSLGLTSSTLRPKRLKSRRGIRARRHAEWKGKSELKRGTVLKGPGSTIIYMICCYLKA